METVTLRPVHEGDLAMFWRFSTEPELVGYDWPGFRDPQVHFRRFATDSYLGEDNGRLMVDADEVTTGFVTFQSGSYGGVAKHWTIGIALLPEHRGRGIGSRAQAALCDYLFAHTPAQRVEAGTQPENVAEQRALEKAGFRLDGVIRAAEFRAGQWRDGLLYSRLRTDPAPEHTRAATNARTP